MARKGSFVQAPQQVALAVAAYRAQAKGQSRVHAQAPDRSRVQSRAAFLLEQVCLAPIEIPPCWGLAGEHLPNAQCWELPPVELSDAETCAKLSKLGIPEEEWPAVAGAKASWQARPRFSTVGECDAENARGHQTYFNDGPSAMVYSGWGWIENHSVRDYAKALRLGFSGIKAEILQRLQSTAICDPEYIQQENFWRAGLLVCEAGELLGQRYAEVARARATQADNAGERERLERMAALCERVPARGAQTFAEAVQSLWLCHVLTCGEDGINANSIGRLDQILWPYYQADIAAGRLTRDEAVELMAELACKLYLEYDVQAITLGGLTADGENAVNELSYVILDATEQVGFIRDLSVRLHRQSPPAFVRRAAELIRRGGGIPFIFNDDCFIPALTERGIPVEEARDYAPIGCIELTIPGKTNPHAVSGWFNALKCLELALFDGLDPKTGQQVGPHTGDFTAMRNLEELYAAYSAQVRFFTERMVYHCNRGELLQREWGPLPYQSVLTDDCIARGRDLTDGGARYLYHAVTFMGTANIADALAAVQTLVFEQHQVSPEELLAALRCDYEGFEGLHQRLCHRAPKYGNDIEWVDALAVRATNDFIALMDTMRSPMGGRYFVHLFTFYFNLPYGERTGATPDGRKAGEPLAYSLSAHQGRDVAGVTALLGTLSRLPHHQAAGASAAIIDLDPKAVEGEEGVERLQILIQTLISMGIGQVQWNVTTRERLRQAQQDPEHYGNIAVRVAGYSQMFKLISLDLQEHIIARTKHTQI